MAGAVSGCAGNARGANRSTLSTGPLLWLGVFAEVGLLSRSKACNGFPSESPCISDATDSEQRAPNVTLLTFALQMVHHGRPGIGMGLAEEA